MTHKPSGWISETVKRASTVVYQVFQEVVHIGVEAEFVAMIFHLFIFLL